MGNGITNMVEIINEGAEMKKEQMFENGKNDTEKTNIRSYENILTIPDAG